MSRVIVSLVSEQTIPNYLFIKEIITSGDELMFISSKKMENKIDWILNELRYVDCIVDKCVFDDEDDEERWNKMIEKIKKSLNKQNKYIVNLTGGTKYMSLAVQEVFENFDSEFFYIPFPKNYLLNPMSQFDRSIPIKYRINVQEYMHVYGLKIKQKGITQSKEYTHYFFSLFTQNKFSNAEYETIDCLRDYREKNIEIKIIEEKEDEEKKRQIKGLSAFLETISFPQKDKEKLSKKETQYITGGWFEEYVYHLIKEKIDPQSIAIGVEIQHTKTTNMNDLDVVFTLGNKLFVIECKTGVGRVLLFNQIVYKASALKETLLGLPSNSYIFSLSPEDDTLAQTAKNMGTNYCDISYFNDKKKMDSLISEIIKSSYNK
ncbi:Card1-like endonuclease domain-containing protein [Parabacteroides sp. Marseille-P3160]|uniref:Card1-like endonuclease domain-containing protein n=1 Tax=Parabacteroides sp. Marseille-P3160 TaxID=1917887 RepID=UPI0009B9F4B4|nr:DUF1887 family CARF protein [Parabacteroides sp. Marseille-P3160]